MHYLVLVIVDHDDDVDGRVEASLQKFRGREFDWHQIGGRWSGTFDGYEPDKDPRNIRTCELCHGTGTRAVPVPGDPRWKPEPGKCNGCGGKGKRAEWPTQWVRYGGDIMPVKDIHADFEPYAVVARGEWHASQRFDGKDWVDEALPDWRKLYADGVGVIVDCHN